MNTSDITMVTFLAAGIVACAVAATYAWFNPQTRGRHFFALACYSACIWMLGDIIGRATSTFDAKYAAEVVRYFGVVNMPVWVFAFTRAYCGRRVSARNLALLLVVPAISFGTMATSAWHQVFFRTMKVGPDGLTTEYGPYFLFVHVPYCYLLTVWGIALVLNEMGRVPSQFRRQIFFLFVSLCVPVAINIADLTGLTPGSYNTALSFPIFAMVLSVGIFRHRFLNVNPIAYENVFLNVHDGVIILSRDDTILDINHTAARHTGRPRMELIGVRFVDAFAEYVDLIAKSRDKKEIRDQFTHPGENDSTLHYTINTSNFIGINNEFDGRTVTLRDITALKHYQDSLETLAYIDPLTRLANRRRFQEEIDKALQRAARSDERFAILYFDLNKFKAVNDVLGHSYGDELLKYVGVRASSLLRAPDFAARLGGDEFVILLHHTAAHEIPVVAARLIAHIEQPFVVNEQTLTPRLSLGAACYPRDGDSMQSLLRHADAEMYRAKAFGGGLAPVQ